MLSSTVISYFSFPSQKKNYLFTLFSTQLLFLYCDRNLKNIGDEGLYSLNAHCTVQESTVFQLEFRAPDFEVEGDHSSSWFGIATEAARPRRGMSGREV